MFNTDEFKGKWKEIKGEIIKKWGSLTDDEVERTRGNGVSLLGLLEQKLGIKKDEANKHLNDLAARYRGDGQSAGKKVADFANQKIDSVKKNLKN